MMNDWKTTVPGLLSAMAMAAMPFFPEYTKELGCLSAVSLAILAYFSKQTEKAK